VLKLTMRCWTNMCAACRSGQSTQLPYLSESTESLTTGQNYSVKSKSC